MWAPTAVTLVQVPAPPGPSAIDNDQPPPVEEKAETRDDAGDSKGEQKEEEETSPLWGQVMSLEFWGLLGFFSLVLLAVQFYVATVEIQLEQKGDKDGVYTQLFNLLFSLGGLATPLAGYLMDVHGFHASFGACAGCLIMMAGVNLATTGLEAQIVVFVAVSMAKHSLPCLHRHPTHQ